MAYLVVILASSILLGLGSALVWLMQLARHATPNTDLRALTLGLRLTGVLTLVAYGLPAVAFSLYFLSQALRVGFDGALATHKEAVTAFTGVGVVLGTIGLSLIVVSLNLSRVAAESGSLRNNPFVLLLLGAGIVLVILNVIVLGLATVFGAFLLAIAVWRYFASRREERRAQVLWTLTLAAEGRRALSQELRDCGAGYGGLFAGRVNHAADLLDSGYSLSSALEAVPGLVPASALLMIRVGEEAGDLPRALREATLTFTRGALLRMSNTHNAGVQLAGFAAVLLVGSFIVTGLVIWIVPKFKSIFAGFNTELPAITQTVMHVLDGSGQYALVLFLPTVALMAVSGYLLVMLFSAIDPSRVIEWQLWGWLRPRVATGTVLRCLGIAIGGGRPLTASLKTLADHFPCRPIRMRLQGVASDVSRGQDVWQSLLRERLLRHEEVELIFAADRAGNLPWALEELASGIERRTVFRIRAVFEFLQPAVIVAAGLVVMFINVAFFMPLVKLIGDLT